MDIIGKWVKFENRPASSTNGIHYNCHRSSPNKGVIYILVESFEEHDGYKRLVASQSIAKYKIGSNIFYQAQTKEEGIVMDFHIQFESMISEVKNISTTMKRAIKWVFK